MNKMPILLGNNVIELFLWNLRSKNTGNNKTLTVHFNLVKNLVVILIKLIFAMNLLKSFCLSSLKGIQNRQSHYESLDSTIIMIEADESTPLLVNRIIMANSNNSCKNSRNNQKESISEKLTLRCGISSWSFSSGNQSNGNGYSALNTKSFKSHFMEIRVLAFALTFTAAFSIAIYLLVIESRLPSITFFLDLVSHDIWSQKIIPKNNHLKHHNVDYIIIMQIGNKSCDTSGECLEVLKEMQNEDLDQAEELPFNFLVGGDGQAYEVRGWDYSSGIKAVPQERSLVIGIIGNYDYRAPNKILLQTAQALIKESSKRRMIKRKYYIYGLRQKDNDHREGQLLFNEIMKWPHFKGFLS